MKIIAYHLDFKRAMWKRPYLDRFVKRLKSWGYNTLVCEMEDKFRFPGHPAICHAEAWKHEAACEFAEKCRKLKMQVIPLMQSLGHLEFIVGKEEYAHLREAPELTEHIDVTNPASIPFLIKLFDEIIDVMKPSQYFHLGGDETWHLGNSKRCGPLLRKHGRGGMYLRHMLPLLEHIHQRGLIPVIWADIALTHPDIIARIPKYVTLMDWEYSTTGERPRDICVWGKGRLNWENLRQKAGISFRRNLMKYAVDKQTRHDGSFRAFYCTDALLDKGFTVLTAPANRCSGDLVGIPLSSRHVPNCYYFARKGVQEGSGTLVTSWAVRHNHPEVDLPATYAAAWGLKRKAPLDQAAFWKAYTVEMFGVELPGFGDAVALAEKGAGLLFLRSYYFRMHSDNLRKKKNSLTRAVANLTKEQGGKYKARAYLGNILRDYDNSAIMFKHFRQKARRNAGNLDFWLEGITADAIRVRMALAVLNKSLSFAKKRLKPAIEKARRQAASLFAGTYLPQSVKAELDMRYGFIGHKD